MHLVSQHFGVPESNRKIGFGESEGTSRFYCAERNLCDLVAERDLQQRVCTGLGIQIVNSQMVNRKW